jgi:hypothetical protein
MPTQEDVLRIVQQVQGADKVERLASAYDRADAALRKYIVGMKSNDAATIAADAGVQSRVARLEKLRAAQEQLTRAAVAAEPAQVMLAAGTKKSTMAMQQLAYGMQDFASSYQYGGMRQAFMAISNNVQMVAANLGLGTKALMGFTAAGIALPFLAPPLIAALKNMLDAFDPSRVETFSERLKRFTDEAKAAAGAVQEAKTRIANALATEAGQESAGRIQKYFVGQQAAMGEAGFGNLVANLTGQQLESELLADPEYAGALRARNEYQSQAAKEKEDQRSLRSVEDQYTMQGRASAWKSKMVQSQRRQERAEREARNAQATMDARRKDKGITQQAGAAVQNLLTGSDLPEEQARLAAMLEKAGRGDMAAGVRERGIPVVRAERAGQAVADAWGQALQGFQDKARDRAGRIEAQGRAEEQRKDVLRKQEEERQREAAKNVPSDPEVRAAVAARGTQAAAAELAKALEATGVKPTEADRLARQQAAEAAQDLNARLADTAAKLGDPGLAKQIVAEQARIAGEAAGDIRAGQVPDMAVDPMARIQGHAAAVGEQAAPVVAGYGPELQLRLATGGNPQAIASALANELARIGMPNAVDVAQQAVVESMGQLQQRQVETMGRTHNAQLAQQALVAELQAAVAASDGRLLVIEANNARLAAQQRAIHANNRFQRGLLPRGGN